MPTGPRPRSGVPDRSRRGDPTFARHDLARVEPEADVRGGLSRRTVLASAALALLVGTVFAVLIRAVTEERDSADQAIRSQEMIAAANRLERLVLDLETGQRGFAITGTERFLEPWIAARAAYPRLADALESATGGRNGQAEAAQRITAAIGAYIAQYSVPLVEAARRGDPAATSERAWAEGRRRVDDLRAQFDAFIDAERARFATREEGADDDAQLALILAAAGLVGSTLLIVLFGTYLVRAVALPLRRAAAMAGQIAGGDLSTRMPETGAGEVGALERSFNTMATSLESSRDELRPIAEEQAALRRVATLVARDVPADELFEAVPAEVRTVLGADGTALLRYEDGDAVLFLAGDVGAGEALRSGTRMSLEDATVSAQVLRSGRPLRVDDYDNAGGPVGVDGLRAGIRTAVGVPIVAGGRLWGVMVATWSQAQPPSPDIEDRMAQFTELVATAIANAQSRAELAASRARVVATADETRRRIERDLHDGAQESLVHTVIALKLARRELGDAGGPAADLLDDALGHAERANEELRELAHGILPATLTRGLGAAIETLASHVRLPVSLDVTDERVRPELEATAYFIVAEALTNTVKHARATRARVAVSVTDGVLRVEISDDGVGGARADGRSGLLGLYDRAAAMNGDLRVDSPPGSGTTVVATIPLGER
jgi:signal transduction histidine kinase